MYGYIKITNICPDFVFIGASRKIYTRIRIIERAPPHPVIRQMHRFEKPMFGQRQPGEFRARWIEAANTVHFFRIPLAQMTLPYPFDHRDRELVNEAGSRGR